MIDKSYVDDAFAISCDVSGCSESMEYQTAGDWDAMLAMAKADGWQFQYDQHTNTWTHSCGGHR